MFFPPEISADSIRIISGRSYTLARTTTDIRHKSCFVLYFWHIIAGKIMLIHTICSHQMCHWEVHKFLSRKLLHVECQSFVLKWQNLPPDEEEQRQCVLFLYPHVPVWIIPRQIKYNRQGKTNKSNCSLYFSFFAKELWNLWKSISWSIHLEWVWSRPAEDLTVLGLCGLLYEESWLQGCQQMVVGTE